LKCRPKPGPGIEGVIRTAERKPRQKLSPTELSPSRSWVRAGGVLVNVNSQLSGKIICMFVTDFIDIMDV
jgi:hypothetical protein